MADKNVKEFPDSCDICYSGVFEIADSKFHTKFNKFKMAKQNVDQTFLKSGQFFLKIFHEGF